MCCCTSSKWSWWCWRRRWGCKRGYRCDHRTVQRIDSRLPRNGHNAEIELVFIKSYFIGKESNWFSLLPTHTAIHDRHQKFIWVMLRFWFKNLSALNNNAWWALFITVWKFWSIPEYIGKVATFHLIEDTILNNLAISVHQFVSTSSSWSKCEPLHNGFILLDENNSRIIRQASALPYGLSYNLRSLYI